MGPTAFNPRGNLDNYTQGSATFTEGRPDCSLESESCTLREDVR